MTSVVDRYYRKILQNMDNVRIKFDISALLVKYREHDSKIKDIENDINEISELENKLDNEIEKINIDLEDKENRIKGNSSDITHLNTFEANLNINGIINDITNIKSDITSLNTYIDNLPNDIDSKIDDITNIKSDITSLNTYIDNLPNDIDSKIDDITNIKSDITSIESDISKINEKIETNKNDISKEHDSKIETIESDISKINEILNNKIPQKTFDMKYDIRNKKFNFNRSSHYFGIFSIDIEK